MNMYNKKLCMLKTLIVKQKGFIHVHVQGGPWIPFPHTLSPCSPKNLSIFSKSGGDSNNKPTACDHGRWPEANVGQQYRKRPDRLMHQMLTVPMTINPEKRPAVGPRPGSIATVSKKTGSLNAPDVNSTDDNQPRKKACCGTPTRG